MLVGMLTRRVIVDEIDANFVADALAPEILVEVVVGARQAPKKMAARSGQCARAMDVTSLGMPRFNVMPASSLARPRQSFAIARRGNSCGYDGRKAVIERFTHPGKLDLIAVEFDSRDEADQFAGPKLGWTRDFRRPKLQQAFPRHCLSVPSQAPYDTTRGAERPQFMRR